MKRFSDRWATKKAFHEEISAYQHNSDVLTNDLHVAISGFLFKHPEYRETWVLCKHLSVNQGGYRSLCTFDAQLGKCYPISYRSLGMSLESYMKKQFRECYRNALQKTKPKVSSEQHAHHSGRYKFNEICDLYEERHGKPLESDVIETKWGACFKNHKAGHFRKFHDQLVVYEVVSKDEHRRRHEKAPAV